MATLIPGEEGAEIRIALYDKDRLFIQTYDSKKQRTGVLVVDALVFSQCLVAELRRSSPSREIANFDVDKACENAKRNAR